MRRKKLLSQADQVLRDMKSTFYAEVAPHLAAHIEHFRERKDEAFLTREVTGVTQRTNDSYEKNVGRLQTHESLYANTIQLLEKLKEEALSFIEASRKPSRQRKQERTTNLVEREKALNEIAKNCSLSIFIIVVSDEETFSHMVTSHPDFVDLWTALPKDPSTLR